MALPKAACPVDTIDVGGEPVEVRGLSRGQLHECNRLGAGDPEKYEVALVAFACAVTYDEAAEWMAEAAAGVVQEIVEVAMELSGMGDVPKASS